ncbi:MAG: type II toxin-antitoxin system Phd/YefM family antitoxin [Protaetiibacter sp.]
MTTLSVADARANFSKLVESAALTHERFEVTKNGARVAVLLGADDYDSLIETLEILGDAEAMTDIREGRAAIARGETHSEAEIREIVRKRRTA